MVRMVFGVSPRWYGYHAQEVPVGEMWLNDLGGVNDLFGAVPVPAALVRRSPGPCCSFRRTRCDPLARNGRVSREGDTSKHGETSSRVVEAKKRTPLDVEVSRDPWAEALKSCREHLHKYGPEIHSGWSARVNLAGFHPDDITLKVDDETGTMRIHASRESEDENGFDRRETLKTVQLPEDIILESIKVSLHPSGTLHIVGKINLDIEDGEHKHSDKKEDSHSSAEVMRQVAEAGKITDKEQESDVSGKEESEERAGDREEANMPGQAETEEKQTDTEMEELSITEEKNTHKTDSEMSDSAGNEDNGEMASPTDKENKHSEKKETTDTMLTSTDENIKTLSDTEEAKEDSSRTLMTLDVSRFAPEKVSVKVSGKSVTVTAEDHQEEEGFVSIHHVKRCFPLPSDANPTSLKSFVDSEGVLKVLVGPPVAPAVEFAQEKAIQMQMEQ